VSVKETLVTLRLTESTEDGHWLHFKDSKGKQAGINIENHFSEPDDIIGSCIRQWAIDQFEKYVCCECPHESKGDCRHSEVEEASGVIGYMNVEYFILRETKPHNCPMDN